MRFLYKFILVQIMIKPGKNTSVLVLRNVWKMNVSQIWDIKCKIIRDALLTTFILQVKWAISLIYFTQLNLRTLTVNWLYSSFSIGRSVISLNSFDKETLRTSRKKLKHSIRVYLWKNVCHFWTQFIIQIHQILNGDLTIPCLRTTY